MNARQPSADPRLRVKTLSEADTDLLKQFVDCEAVVPVQSPDDLRRRMAPDRRLLAILDEDDTPLVFVNVALCEAFPERLERILAGPVAPLEAPSIAVFYGITRASPRARGRAGALLHRAVEAVCEQVPSISDAVTLSPMPGFRPWLEEILGLQGHSAAAEMLERMSRKTAAGLLPAEQAEKLQTLARFFLGRVDSRGRAADPVARFHLRNGAQIRDIIVGADCSWHGLRQSLGVMVSYTYSGDRPLVLDEVDADNSDEAIFAAIRAARSVA